MKLISQVADIIRQFDHLLVKRAEFFSDQFRGRETLLKCFYLDRQHGQPLVERYAFVGFVGEGAGQHEAGCGGALVG